MTLVDEARGATLGGRTLAEKFQEKWGGSYDVSECVEALRNWVVAAGYNDDGVFEVEYSNYRL